MTLCHKSLKKLKPNTKPYKVADEKGLFILVNPNGSYYWRFRYRFLGKDKTLALGTFPDVSLASARNKRDEARRLLSDEIDPGIHRKVMKKAKIDQASNTFEIIAREWFAKQTTKWSKVHADKILRLLERDIFPWIGAKPITEIPPPVLHPVLARIIDRGSIETSHRALSNCSQIFDYAVACGHLQFNTSKTLIKLLPAVKGTHFAAPTDPKRLGEFLRMMDGYHGTLIVKCALRLAPLVFVRPGELRHAKWEGIDFETAEWRYLITKTDTQHIVPLSTQALNILHELYPLTKNGEFVFPSLKKGKSRTISDNTLLSALRELGIPKEELSIHGFRATARTLLDEVLGVRPDFIEHQLGHAVRDPLGRAYNRTKHLLERKKMMQDWANYLDSLKN
ncbi:TPA: integrase arm-type DNA-binding domain-containing protein [Legionella pneumophila]|nr:integrase arm-type DNA-binding domain-containing protein [Legionella pneumophila]